MRFLGCLRLGTASAFWVGVQVMMLALNILTATKVWADLTWTGLYRVEGNYIPSVGLDGSSSDKEYILHHFILSPKFVLLDGFELLATVDAFNQGDYATSGSQAGQTFGAGFAQPNGSFYGADGSVALSDHQIHKVRDANIRELYLRYVHTGGELTVGRAPLHFGLGISLNAGRGDFDHWFDNRDMLAYKIYFGSLSGQAFAARITDGFNADGDSASEIGGIIKYQKAETGLEMGAMYLARHTPGSVNQSQLATSGAAAIQRYGAYIERHVPKSPLRYALEIGVNSGRLGYNTSGEEIDFSGFGAVAEVDYSTPLKGLAIGLKAGYASGQDGSEDDGFSTFAFDRNYNLGILLFNHPLGNGDLDLLGTTPYGKMGPYYGSGSYSPSNSIDTESIANAMFAAPYVAYTFNSEWHLKSTWIWAQLDQDIVNSVLYSTTNPGLEVDKNLGVEWDISLSYRPFERLLWETTIAAFFPGAAFEGGAQDYETKTIFGGVSRVSIRLD